MSDFPNIKHPKKRAFLTAYAECGTVTHAAKAAQVCRQTPTNWLAADEEFVAAFAVAKEIACDTLESAARQRAVDGWDEPVYYNGDQCGVKRKFSDTLLIFLLKGANPEKYSERIQQTHRGDASAPVQFYMPHNGRDSASVLSTPPTKKDA